MHSKPTRTSCSRWKCTEAKLRSRLIINQNLKSWISISNGKYSSSISTRSRRHKCTVWRDLPSILICMMGAISTQKSWTVRNGAWLATYMRSLQAFQNSLRLQNKLKIRLLRRRKLRMQKIYWRKFNQKRIKFWPKSMVVTSWKTITT